MKPISSDTRTLTGRVLQTLRDAILAGSLEPESPIRIDEVARELNVSAIPVREAVLRLVAEGFIVSEPHKGYKVAPVSKSDLLDIYMVRLMLEPEAARKAVPLLTDEDLDDLKRLESHITACTTAGAHEATLKATREFHFRLYQVLGSSRLLNMVSILWDQSERYRRLYIGSNERASEVIEVHRSILAACTDKQADRCAEAVTQDLNRTIRALVRQLGKADACEIVGKG